MTATMMKRIIQNVFCVPRLISGFTRMPKRKGKTIDPAPTAPRSDILTKDASTLLWLGLRVESGVSVLFAVLYSGKATA